MHPYVQTIQRDLLIAYANLPFLNPARFRRLLETFGSASTICDVSERELISLLGLSADQARLTRNPLALPELRRRVEHQRESVITLLDESYPSLLRQIIDPPPALFYRGHPSVLSAPAIAIVGTRRPSPYGINAARLLARELARNGMTIISGLARGIDSAAHLAALEADGQTVAVLGTGVDVAYPRQNRKLSERIIERSCIVSEFPAGTMPRPMNFPVRNRVISGLSLGVIVVEAADRSGSLITARMASEQGREVFAVPGSIFSTGSSGPHRLIESGARIVTTAQDVLEELGLELMVVPNQAVELEPQHRALLVHLSCDTPTHVDTLAELSGESNGALAVLLLELEVAGAVRALPGGRYVSSA